ncbi:MAG: flagellar brake protein [Lachnospiraceae bacterium]
MLTKYVEAGEKVELQIVSKDAGDNPDVERRVYTSQVYEVLSEDRLEITMPMEKTKLILLPVDSEYDVYFYTEAGLLQCFARIIDRYKSNNVYILVLELISNLRKYQRREFYRFACALEMNTRPLQEEELSAIDSNHVFLTPGLPLKRSIIVDISGGGLRFISNQRYEVGSHIYCGYKLLVGGEQKEYNIVGKVLRVKELENRPGEFEHRVQYVNMNTVDREEIIKYIFDEERKTRKRNQR